mmetsp:Transcript_1955/g.5310  ORF Transcript_1955/g.5310 Transcript_1955/m.5310 type:complete len:515 (-) Transcript_1955:51-1595(-)
MSRQATLFSYFGPAPPKKPAVQGEPAGIEPPAPSTGPTTPERKRERTTVSLVGPDRKKPALKGAVFSFQKQLLEEDTILCHRNQLSPSMKNSKLAASWEFASVLDFFRVFGPEVLKSCKACLAAHTKRERKAWPRNERTRYTESDLNSACSFSPACLLGALEHADEDAKLQLADIHIVMLKGLHARAHSPPCRMNWLEYVGKAIRESWAQVCEGSPPPCFSRDAKDEGAGDGLGALYDGLEASERLRVLRFLCEVCCERNTEIATRLESAKDHSCLTQKSKEMAAEMRPGDKPVEVTIPGLKRSIMISHDLEFVDDIRHTQEFAQDYYCRRYFLLQPKSEAQWDHCFMLRERKPEESSGQPTFEVVCSSGEEFIKFVEDHVDVTLFGAKTRKKFRDYFGDIKQWKEEAEKLELAREKVKKELGDNPFSSHSLDVDQGRRGSRRARKTARYAEVESSESESEESESEEEEPEEISESGGEESEGFEPEEGESSSSSEPESESENSESESDKSKAE